MRIFTMVLAVAMLATAPLGAQTARLDYVHSNSFSQGIATPARLSHERISGLVGEIAKRLLDRSALPITVRFEWTLKYVSGGSYRDCIKILSDTSVVYLSLHDFNSLVRKEADMAAIIAHEIGHFITCEMALGDKTDFNIIGQMEADSAAFEMLMRAGYDASGLEQIAASEPEPIHRALRTHQIRALCQSAPRGKQFITSDKTTVNFYRHLIHAIIEDK